MIGLVLRRMAQLFPTMLIVTIVVFAITAFLPGDPAMTVLGEGASQAQIDQVRDELGLDDPLVVQYGKWLVRIVQGDFGRSLRTGQRVAEMLVARVPVTLELTLGAMLLAVIVGVPLGVLAARNRNTWIDAVSTTAGLICVAIPYFWLGLLLILLFSIQLRILPPSGYVPFSQDPVANLRLMIMPVVCIGLSISAVVMRQARGSMIQVLSQDYIRTARAKGANERRTLVRHALPNALNPVITVIGLQVGALLGGAVVTETVFSLPGLGKMLVDGILNRDYPVVQGAVLVVVLCVVLVNLLVDIAYGIFDPRVKG